MKRTQIYLDESQDERLARRAAATGVTKSTLIREAIDAYFEGRGREEARLSRFRAAVQAAAGTAEGLPPGREYVEDLRALEMRRREELESRRRG